MSIRHLVILLVAAIWQVTASAQSLLTEDFQDRTLNGWLGNPGRGDIQLTEYEGNVSLRLSRNAWAAITLQPPAEGRIAVSADFAAVGLEARDACILEASSEAGTWIEIGRLDAKTASPVMLKTVAGDLTVSVDTISVRVRAGGNAANDTCWADNIRVSYSPLPSGAALGTAPPSIERLLRKEAYTTPLAAGSYAPSTVALPPGSELHGVLKWSPAPVGANKRVYVDRYGADSDEASQLSSLPPLDITLVQSGDRLLPAERSLLLTNHPHWDYILTPGRVWQEPGDGDWSRAALPFALVEKNANCTHNGLLTFAFKADGTTTPSLWQVGSETCAYLQFDAWGTADTRLVAEETLAAEAVRARDLAERQSRLEVRGISALAIDYPGIDLEPFGSPADVAPSAMTAFGLVVGDVHYAGGCETRYGPYPYCDELVVPSYSFAKSLFAGLALMRLELLYPGAMSAKISDHVPACKQTGTWDDVTFENALDMATGHYLSGASEADENAATEGDFFVFQTREEKTRFACEHFPHRAKPGKTWVYHTTDTYLLGEAMQAFLRARLGDNADIYRDLLVGPIWKPLGLSATLDETRRTADAGAQPFTGWGLFMQRGDLAHLMRFLSSEDGSIAGRNAVDPKAFSAALQKTPADPGLPADKPPLAYNNGFWSWDIQAHGGCSRPTPIPFMSGFGGLVAALIPNGTSYYYISDGGAFAWARAALATEMIKPFCQEAAQ